MESEIADDGLPIMEVGDWAVNEKHRILGRYIDISHRARAKYTTRTYVDLFSGPGRIRIKGGSHLEHGSPIAALRMSESKSGGFTDFYIADLDEKSLAACETRLRSYGVTPVAKQGYAHETIDYFIQRLPARALHLAILDPFNLSTLHFSIIEKLAYLPRIDIIVHLSTGDLQRNIGAQLTQTNSSFDLVAPGWRDVVAIRMSKSEMSQRFIEHWKSLVSSTGLMVSEQQHRVKNSKSSVMYRLLLLAKHDLAHHCWTEACKIDQNRSLF